MRILSWVQTKINRKQEKKKRSGAAPVRNHAAQDSCKEEFSDWPQGLFSIGTFGRNELKKHSNNHEDFENSHPLQNLPEFTLEEVNKLEKELIKLLSLKPNWKDPGSESGMRHDSDNSFSEFPDCHSSLEANRSICLEFCEELERSGEDDELSPKNKIIFNKAKDLLGGKQNNANIGRKSISFLFRKLFLCRSDFAPAPSLKDPVSESKMEKFLKIVLHKKIYPQNSTPTTVKKYLEEKQVDKAKIRDKLLMMAKDKTKEKPGGEFKWVKTDSEWFADLFNLIVLTFA
ncbi:hypothetical protein Taro_006031 [Colocasia esculenta]|uniref:Uncharacterized protein n=1 Tax=Colocasia esculenta TaxID=4460 RepID=A0A843TRE0_COLES|nr:hypothetical protein [Colocasia esculenta]